MDDKKIIYGIYGAGGFGKEVLPLVVSEAYKLHANENKQNIFFIVDKEYATGNTELQGCKIISFEDFLQINANKKYISIAIGNGKAREILSKKCISHNINILSVKHNNVVIYDEVNIGEGATLCPFVTLTSNITIGKNFQANLYSYVGHDCVIGDYVTFAPAVKCNGHVEIGDYAYIGTGAIIKEGKHNKPIRIGKGATVAAGAFVTKDVPDGVTVFGNPAIELTKENLKRRT